MFSSIYVEREVRQMPRVQAIIQRFADLPLIEIERYGEVFNRRAQNFRIQKQAPALILARKHGQLVMPAPSGYGFESGAGYYFSHMLNCLYDCRYCFLQGMYRSAHYVLFVNYEDFADQLQNSFATQSQPAVYYSGYDCDSLAMEPVSRFCDFFMPLFRDNPGATLEIRTKSTQVRQLLNIEPLSNCIVAMSFTSEQASQRWEHKVPGVHKRLEALARLQRAGWKVALRFEPIIAEAGAVDDYQQLFEQVFTQLDADRIHSVSLGEFRMPVDFYKNIVKLYPDELLYAKPTRSDNGVVALRDASEGELLQTLEEQLLGFVGADQYYRCAG